MGYFYKAGNCWRLTVYRNGHKGDINLGKELEQAKILKASIEQTWQSEKFKTQLAETLSTLGLLKPGYVATSSEQDISWDLATARLIEYLKGIGRKEKTIGLVKYVLDHIKVYLAPKKPADITPEKSDMWISQLANTPKKNSNKKFSASTVNIYVRTAKACFSRFLRWSIVEKNPFSNCDMPKVEKTLPNPFSDDELNRLLKACNKPLRRCIEILVYSGMRPDEFYHLPWRRVILGKNPYIHIKKDQEWTPKAHTERIIPCSKDLLIALRKPGASDELVAGKNEAGFPVNKDWMQRSFSRAIKRAKLTDRKFTIYSCRDTFATNLALAGNEAHMIAARLGHGNLETSMRYVSFARLNKSR